MWFPQDRATSSGLDHGVEAWLRAAGALRYVLDNFTNAPSVDLAADTLLVLAALMTVSRVFPLEFKKSSCYIWHIGTDIFIFNK